jgi:hypothetical protein
VAIAVHTKHLSESSAVVWCKQGVALAPTSTTPVPLMGGEGSKAVATVQGTVRYVEVSYADEDADLAMIIVMRHAEMAPGSDADPAPLPEEALALLDRILASFSPTEEE